MAKEKRKLANSTKRKTQLTINVFNAVADIFPEKNGESTSKRLLKYLYKKMEEDKLIRFNGVEIEKVK